MNLEKHSEWIKKIIDSCETPEQLAVCKVIIDHFVARMASDRLPFLTIRKQEDALLEFFIAKESSITIF